MGQQQQIPLMQSRGGGGGGSPDLARVAITNFITDQSKASQKMMKNFEQLQQAQAQSAREDSQQQTQAMNRVADKSDEKQRRKEDLNEKYKDRDHAEEYAEWTTKFKEQAKQDFARTQTRIGEQMTAGRNFITRMDTNRRDFGDKIKAQRAYLFDPGQQEYWMNTPGGMDRLEAMQRRLRAADAFHESDFQSKYTGQVARLMSEVHENIQSGESHVDLTALYDIKPSSLSRELDLTDHDDGDWTEAEIRELRHTGGYPPGGLYGRDPDDPALKKYNSFNPIHHATHMQLLMDEQIFASLGHAKFQDEYLTAQMQYLADRAEVHGKLRKNDDADFNFIAEHAERGVYGGVVSVVEDLHSGKLSPDTLHAGLILNSGSFNDPDLRHALAGRVLESAFIGAAGPGGEGLLRKMNEVLDGTGDTGLWDTNVELGLAFAMRVRLTHVQQQLRAMMRIPTDSKDNPIKGAVSLSTAMGDSILKMDDSPAHRNLLRALAMQQGDEQRGKLLRPIERTSVLPFGGGDLTVASQGRIHKGVDGVFALALQKVNHLLDIVESQPAMKGYNSEAGDVLRRTDAYVKSYYSDKEQPQGPLSDKDMAERREFALENITDEQKRASFGDAPEGYDLKKEKLNMKIKLSPMQAYLELMGEHTDNPELIAALISGDYDNAAPMFPKMKGATRPQMEQALVNYAEKSKKLREAVKLELKRRRDAHGKDKDNPKAEPGKTKTPEVV